MKAALTSVPADTLLADSGLAGSGLAGSGLAEALLPDTAQTDPDVVETTPLPVVLARSVPLPRPADAVSYLQSADAALLPRPDDVVPGLRAHSHSKRRSAGASTGDKAATRGTARGYLMTPWFAAAAGFVLAAGMWIISPHADLISTSPAIGRSTLGAGDNRIVAGRGNGLVPVPSPSESTRASRHHGGSGANRKKAPPVTVYYHGHALQNGKFFVLVTLPKGLANTQWTLRFQVPGDQDIQVCGASWHTSGQDGGFASEQPADPAGEQDSQHAGWHLPQGVNLSVVGTGTDTKPTGCRLNGATCRFVYEPLSPPSGATSK